MSLLKNKTLCFISFMVMATAGWSQSTPPATPTICTTPPAGYLAGGAMSVAPNTSCVPLGGSTLTNVTITNKNDPNRNVFVDNPIFYFDIDNNFNIATATNGVAGVANSVSKQLNIGYHWILMKGEKNGNNYLSCILQENLLTSIPTVTATSCGGNTITVTIPNVAENQYNRYMIDWGNGDFDFINTSTLVLPQERKKTYSGTPNTIKIQGSYIRNNTPTCPSNTIEISPDSDKNTLLHTLKGENNGKEVKLEFVGGSPGAVYDVMAAVDNGSTLTNWSKLAEGINGKATVTGLDPNNKYCFKLRSKNTCGLDVFSLNTLCTVNLQATVKSSSSIDLKWNLPTEPNSIPTRLNLEKDEEGCTNCYNNIPFNSQITTNYSVGSLDCSKKYLYQVKYKYANITFEGTSLPINIHSAQIKIDLKSNLIPAKPEYLVSVGFDPNDDTRVRVNIVTDANSNSQNKYTFFRAENDSQVFEKLGERNDNVFDDVAISAEIKSYCYKYQIEDKCGVISELSDPFCTIMLNSKSQGTLNWSPYLIPPDIYTSASPVDYSLEYFDEGFNSFIPLKTTEKLEQSVQDLLDGSVQSQIKFRVMGRQYVDTDLFPDQFINSYSNPFVFQVPPGLFAPSAFTPDGQGPDDSETFKIMGKFVASGSFKIFDRWGATIFEADNLAESWNGTEKNGIEPAPPGTYAYIIHALSDNGETFRKTGSVLLLR
ncbi:MAG: gliding motility-associated C-terminal domain-containing protein [Leadbetterella sp.]|nr:gliding motility-associated C-terminal domain-containing protein [Leadbetterella sp.]